MRLHELKRLAESITAYHGTKSMFDDFLSKHIGSGEGAQAFGHGLYFSESREVAKSYSPRNDEYEDAEMRIYNQAIRREDYITAEVFELAMMHYNPDEIKDRYVEEGGYGADHVAAVHRAADETLRPLYDKYFHGIYRVEINAEPGDFLDWDKTLLEQRSQIGKLRSVAADPNSPFTGNHLEMLGDSLQDFELGSTTGASIIGVLGSDDTTAQVLVKSGIPGIRYLDADSRGSGDGTYNYVVFDERIIKIIGKE
jgi:hypothetical protein